MSASRKSGCHPPTLRIVASEARADRVQKAVDVVLKKRNLSSNGDMRTEELRSASESRRNIDS